MSINPGTAFSVRIGDDEVAVFYTKEFVRRCERDEPGRPAVCKLVAEAAIRRKIEEALPIIVQYFEGDPGFEGIIKSASLKLNMSFATVSTRTGIMVRMKNAMVKVGYVATSLSDYEIRVTNPPVQIRFVKGVDSDLKAHIVTHLSRVVLELEDGTAYHLGDADIEYWVERAGDILYIDEASWVRDVMLIDVP